MKKFIRKLIPGPILAIYHLKLAILANLVYRWPSRQLKVIGVTGTNGKTTTCNLIWQILTEAGYKTGLTTSINFKIGEQSWTNLTKQGMQGRFRLQQLLRQMVQAGCQYAVIETTSEGIKQYRHWGIKYDVAVFTNLTPEHIETHGSFEKYREAKGKLFRKTKVSVINLDDENAEYFMRTGQGEKIGYSVQSAKCKVQSYSPKLKVVVAEDIALKSNGSDFIVNFDNQSYHFKTNLLGEFNVYNSLAAICVGVSQNIEISVIQQALAEAKPPAGRMEVIYDKERDITVIVDYAHDPAALEKVYQTLDQVGCGHHVRTRPALIAVLGAVGGGRDKAKRPKLGALASKYAKYVIVTNEDPYDDDPEEIMRQVEAGVKADEHRQLNQNYWMILDRAEAIKKAIDLAQPGDIIALTGKGCEEVMAVKDGFIPWDDRQVVFDFLGRTC